MTIYDAESPFDQLVGARERGERPVAPRANLRRANLRRANLTGADLRGTDLRGADLREANLTGADLREANLTGADLREANLTGANLTGANLTGADLRGTDLRGTDLRGTNLRGTDLRGTDLRGTNLRGADLRGADLREANPRGVRILHLEGLPSGETIFIPTAAGWYLTVGCWEGNLEDFKTLIASDEGWPEARGSEVTRRRPALQAVAALCEAHMCLYPDIIEELAEKWQETEGLGVDRG